MDVQEQDAANFTFDASVFCKKCTVSVDEKLQWNVTFFEDFRQLVLKKCFNFPENTVLPLDKVYQENSPILRNCNIFTFFDVLVKKTLQFGCNFSSTLTVVQWFWTLLGLWQQSIHCIFWFDLITYIHTYIDTSIHRYINTSIHPRVLLAAGAVVN